MLIENAFTVVAPADELWARLQDVEQLAPCVPGAELTETVDATTWKGKMSVKLGAVALSFVGTVQMTARDDDAHRVLMLATGTEAKGKGAAKASVTAWLEEADGATVVRIESDITLQGQAAQLSRGLLPLVSERLTKQFADCLQIQMSDENSPQTAIPSGPEAG